VETGAGTGRFGTNWSQSRERASGIVCADFGEHPFHSLQRVMRALLKKHKLGSALYSPGTAASSKNLREYRRKEARCGL
jgi:hypothetical protein